MAALLNHTIVWSSDKAISARFLADILGLPEPEPFGRFLVAKLGNDVSLDFATKDGTISAQHYAFLVGDAEFDAGMARIAELGLQYWADPARTQAGQINHRWGGRGVYFEDPDGHVLEMMTRPYGSEDDLRE